MKEYIKNWIQKQREQGRCNCYDRLGYAIDYNNDVVIDCLVNRANKTCGNDVLITMDRAYGKQSDKAVLTTWDAVNQDKTAELDKMIDEEFTDFMLDVCVATSQNR